MSAISAPPQRAKWLLVEHPEYVPAVNYLMDKPGEWCRTQDIREQFGLTLSDWKHIYNKFGDYNGANVFEKKTEGSQKISYVRMKPDEESGKRLCAILRRATE